MRLERSERGPDALAAGRRRAAAELRLQRRELETLLERNGLIDLLDDLLERVLAGARAAGVQPRDLDAVLPVGGSSRLPLIRRWLEERLPGVPCAANARWRPSPWAPCGSLLGWP